MYNFYYSNSVCGSAKLYKNSASLYYYLWYIYLASLNNANEFPLTCPFPQCAMMLTAIAYVINHFCTKHGTNLGLRLYLDTDYHLYTYQQLLSSRKKSILYLELIYPVSWNIQLVWLKNLKIIRVYINITNTFIANLNNASIKASPGVANPMYNKKIECEAR